MASRGLHKEIKKKQPFDSLEQEAMLNILRTNDLFQNRFGRLFRQHGLTSSQYNVLRILRGEGMPLPCLEIAERMVQVVPAITGLIDRLEKATMVSRQRSEEDRRVIHVNITQLGLETLARMDEPVTELHKELLGHMKRSALRDLSRLLEEAREPLTPGG